MCVQIDARQRMNVLLYHGKRKEHVSTAVSLAAYSVVVTSYTMLANECGSTSVTKKGAVECLDLASDDELGATSIESEHVAYSVGS